jgi:uncharacterized tellurite resistance protein B-like protein
LIDASHTPSIWQKFRTLFEQQPDARPDPAQRIRLAAAVLLVEMARADDEHDDEERETLVRLLTQRFELQPEESRELVESAERSADRSVSLHEHLETLNRGLDQAQKRSVLKMLWQVAYADNRLDRYEEHLLRQVAELLHLAHEDYIRMKLEVQDAAQST